MKYSLFVVAAIFAVAGASTLPETMIERLFRRQNAVCSGDPSTDLLACVEPLQYLGHPSAGFKLGKMGDAHALDVVCHNLTTAKNCMVETHSNCGQGDMMSELMTRSVVGVVEHVCDDEGKRVILEEADCWKHPQLQSRIEQCGSSMQYGPRSDPCVMVNRIRDCVRDSVRQLCNRRAAKFMDDLIYYSIEPMASEMLHCQIRLRVARSILNMLQLP